MSTSQPPVDVGPVAFVGLTPFLWLVRGSGPWRSLLLGFAFGFAYYGALVYWVIPLSVLGWAALCLTLSAYSALFALLGAFLWRPEHPVRSAVGVALLWTAVDYVRSMWPLGGFTWGGVAYSQAGNGFLLPLASITGAWGVTFVVVLVNALLLHALDRVRAHRPAAALAGGVCLAVVLLPSLAPIPAANGERLDVAVVQGNDIAARLPEDIRPGVIAAKEASLHLKLASDPPDLAIWPEDSVDLDPAFDPAIRDVVVGAIRAVGVPTLVGEITGPPDGSAPLYNESLLYDGAGNVVGRYTKVHLLPFGEFVPWRRWLGFVSALRQIPRDLSPGHRARLLSVDGIRFANVICYENSFPSLVRGTIDRGGELLVVSTNNASFGHTALSEEHVVMSRFRAVENGRWVVHAAVSGISAFIDPHGNVYQRTGLFQQAIDRRVVQASTAKTIYTRYGDYFPWTALGLSALLLVAPRRRRRARTPEPLPGDARVLVILPTYNEAATVGAAITGALAAAPGADVLVVDDGSPDGTGEIVRSLSARDPRIRLLSRPAKAGLASAYVAGFREAVEAGYDLVVEMDADLSHRPDDLPVLLLAAGSLDLAIGSRYVGGGGVTNWGLVRRAISRAGNEYARVVLGMPVADATSGYRVFRRHLVRRLLAEGIRADGYGFQIELAYRAWRAGYAVGEVPITFREREHGHSKISRRIIVEALWLVTVWGLLDRLGLRRRPAQVEPSSTGSGRDRAALAKRP